MKLTELKVGDTIIADEGFTCMPAGAHKIHGDGGKLFIHCTHGRHYLDGQEGKDGRLIGLSEAT